jgi:hypothetical protein
MSETIPGGNINQTAGDRGWRQNPALRNPNPIRKMRQHSQPVNSAPTQSNVSNPGAGITPPNSGTLHKVS